MNLNGSTYIDTPGYEFMAALTELKSLVQWLENAIHADTPCDAWEASKRIKNLGSRLQRKLDRHMECLEYAEAVAHGVNGFVSRLDGTEKQISWELDTGFYYMADD